MRSCLILGLGFVMGGCAYSVPPPTVPEFLPSYGPVDVAASEVTLEDGDRDLNREEAAEIRQEIAEILDDAKRAPSEAPMRFRAKIKRAGQPGSSVGGGSTSGSSGEAVVVAIAAGAVIGVVIGVCYPLGCTLDSDDLSVELTMDINGTRVVGRGSASRAGSVHASGRARTLATALQKALMDAEEQWLRKQRSKQRATYGAQANNAH